MEYIIAFVLFLIVLAVIAFFLKKEQNKLKEMASNLNEEQKNKLASTQVEFVEGKNDEWIQDGVIGEMRDKGNKFAIRVLWHNKVIQNATYNHLQYGDTTLSKKDVEENSLEVGSFVKLYIAPAKTSGCFKIIL